MEEIKKNIDRFKNMNVAEMAAMLKNEDDRLIYQFINVEKWLEAPIDADIYDFCTGEKGIYHDRDCERECWVIERKSMMKAPYVRIITKNTKRPMEPTIYTVPAHLVSVR